MSHKDHFIRSLIDYLFRRKHPARYLVGSGVTLFGSLLAGMSADVNLPLPNGTFRLSFSLDGGSGVVSYVALLVSGLLIVGGMLWLYDDWKKADRRRVFAIELRGLRDWNGTPLVQSIPPGIVGQRTEILLDLRQRVADGVIVAPDAAIERLQTLRSTLDQHEDGRDRSDMTFIAAGIAPVPLSFLAGVLLDDEAPITFYDWDRDVRLWDALNRDDDGERFTIAGLDGVPDGTREVIIIISASYRVDEPAALARAGNLPTVRLALPTINTKNHWSEGKQRDLARQFLDTMTNLKGRRVKHVHMFFAGANSLVLRFGSVYDKRNLPALTVYQYESERFTWGVSMPVAGAARPTVVRSG